MSIENDVDLYLRNAFTGWMHHPLDREEGRSKDQNPRVSVRTFIYLTGHESKVLAVLAQLHQEFLLSLQGLPQILSNFLL
jgi:hypothetical protein